MGTEVSCDLSLSIPRVFHAESNQVVAHVWFPRQYPQYQSGTQKSSSVGGGLPSLSAPLPLCGAGVRGSVALLLQYKNASWHSTGQAAGDLHFETCPPLLLTCWQCPGVCLPGGGRAEALLQVSASDMLRAPAPGERMC